MSLKLHKLCVFIFSDEIKIHYKSSLGEKASTFAYSFRLQFITAGVNYHAWFQAAGITEKSLEQELWRTVSLRSKSEERNGCIHPLAQLDSPLFHRSRSLRLLKMVTPTVDWPSNLNQCNEGSSPQTCLQPILK